MKIWPGQSYPLGATYDGSGTNFSLFSEVAERVELCLFDEQGQETHVDLPEATGDCWHGYLPEVEPGQRYGYRVHGPWEPNQGHMCNPAKLLLDPYAKSIDGQIKWDEAVFPYRFDSGPETKSESDSVSFMPRCVVHQPHFDWNGDRLLQTPWHETVIYETHVKGLTARHPEVPEELRGTYAGLAHPSVIEYLVRLGITAIELMPIHFFPHDKHLVDSIKSVNRNGRSALTLNLRTWGLIYVPDPCFRTINPSSSSMARACLRVVRLVPSILDRSSSLGICPPSGYSVLIRSLK